MQHEGPREISEWGGVGLGRFHFGWPSERGEHLTHKRQGCGNCLPVHVSQSSQAVGHVSPRSRYRASVRSPERPRPIRGEVSAAGCPQVPCSDGADGLQRRPNHCVECKGHPPVIRASDFAMPDAPCSISAGPAGAERSVRGGAWLRVRSCQPVRQLVSVRNSTPRGRPTHPASSRGLCFRRRRLCQLVLASVATAGWFHGAPHAPSQEWMTGIHQHLFSPCSVTTHAGPPPHPSVEPSWVCAMACVV
jgi:hypothetical protein